MKIVQELNYRNAIPVLNSISPGLLNEIREILTGRGNCLDLSKKGRQRDLSRQVQAWFIARGWQSEVNCSAIPDMRYDLIKDKVPIEIELGHQRLVFPDFFKFLADYSKQTIPAAIMIVTGKPMLFGNNWHCSIESTKRKIQAVKEVFLVPLLVIGIDPDENDVSIGLPTPSSGNV